MRPIFQSPAVTDEMLIREMNTAVTAESERISKFVARKRSVRTAQTAPIAILEAPQETRPSKSKEQNASKPNPLIASPVAKLKVVLVVPGTTVDYLSKFFSVSELIANVVSAFVDKLRNLNGFIIPVSLPGPVLLTPCAETVYRNAHVRCRARK